MFKKQFQGQNGLIKSWKVTVFAREEIRVDEVSEELNLASLSDKLAGLAQTWREKSEKIRSGVGAADSRCQQ